MEYWIVKASVWIVKTVSRMMSVLQQARQAGAATKREILFLVVFFEHQV
jgi:hypothetical protein